MFGKSDHRRDAVGIGHPHDRLVGAPHGYAAGQGVKNIVTQLVTTQVLGAFRCRRVAHETIIVALLVPGIEPQVQQAGEASHHDEIARPGRAEPTDCQGLHVGQRRRSQTT